MGVRFNSRLDQIMVELRYALRSLDWNPKVEVIEAIADWYAQGVAAARADVWVPGMAGTTDPRVDQILTKYYSSRISDKIDQLIAENVNLKRQVIIMGDACRAQLVGGESAYASTQIGIGIFDRSARYLDVNELLAKMNGTPSHEHIGRPIREIVPALADQGEALVEAVIASREPVMHMEFEGETPAAPRVKKKWMTHWSPLKKDHGEVVAINVVVEEITGRRKRDAGRVTFDPTIVPFGRFVAVLDTTLKLKYVNGPARRLIGIDVTDTRPLNIQDFVAENELSRFKHEVLPAVLKWGHWSGEFVLRHLITDAVIPVTYDMRRIDDSDGGPKHFATTARPTASRKQ